MFNASNGAIFVLQLRTPCPRRMKSLPNPRVTPPWTTRWYLEKEMKRALLLLAFLAGCASATHRAATYSNASVAGKYRITSTVKPYVKFAGGPKIGTGEVRFDGRGN